MNSRRVLRFIWPCIASAFVVIGAHNATAQTPTNTFPNNGNAGIGTTSPSTDLHISSSSPTRGIAQIIGASGSTGAQIQLTQGGVDDWAFGQPAGVSAFSIWSGRALGSNGTERFRIDNIGNVGVGTISPSQKLEVNGNILATGQLQSYGADGAFLVADPTVESGRDTSLVLNAKDTSHFSAINFRTAGTADRFIMGFNVFAGDSAATLQIGNASSLIMSLNTNGNVGIGTSSPSRKFDVSGTNLDSSIRLSNPGTSGRSFTWFSTDSTSASILGGAGKLSLYDETGGATRLVIDNSGNIGVGTTSPGQKLDVVGNINVSGSGAGNITASGTINAKYQDVAEWVPSSEKLSAGTVVVLDSTKSNQVTSSSVSYDTRVAGVVSEQPGIALGEKSESKVLVATTGRVRVKVDASKGAIHIGDLLVTSDIPGVAMKSEPVEFAGRKMHMPGTLIGKALEPLEKGKGEILVLLSLQ